MENKLALADVCDIVALFAIQSVTVSEVLEWIYMILFIISLTLGIVLKVISAFKDGKLTEEEAKEIKKAVDEAKDEVEKEERKEGK